MERLWSPWRLAYVTGTSDAQGCVFCEALASESAAPLVLFRGDTCYVILNLYPYNNGHLMVVPFCHTSGLESLDSETRLELMDLSALAVKAVKSFMRPDGFNLGMNIGRSAGAGIADHLHLHVVPRWNGDTNFMPVIGFTKVISEGLEDNYRRLREAMEKIMKQS